jgi:hypothetical protein
MLGAGTVGTGVNGIMPGNKQDIMKKVLTTIATNFEAYALAFISHLLGVDRL